jgi:hypothetical protein
VNEFRYEVGWNVHLPGFPISLTMIMMKHTAVLQKRTLFLWNMCLYIHVHFTDPERVDMGEYETCQYITPPTYTKRQRHVTYNNVTIINYQ